MPWSKVAFLGDILPFNRNPYNGYINPYYWVDDHPLLYGNNGSLDPGTVEIPLVERTGHDGTGDFLRLPFGIWP